MPSTCGRQVGWRGLKHGVHVDPFGSVKLLGRLSVAVRW